MPQRWESRRAGAEGVSECVREQWGWDVGGKGWSPVLLGETWL